MPEGVALAAPKLIQAVGIALVLCCVAVNRARQARPSANKGRRQQRQAKDLKRKRPGIQNQVCEGLADLIEDQAASPEEEQAGPLMTREDLARGLLVVVVIGPASTKVYQSYVVNKLMRYLRWSNLVRRHFPIADGQDSVREEEDSAPQSGANRARPAVNGITANGNGNGHATSASSVDVDAQERNGPIPADYSGGGEGHSADRGKRRAHRYTFSDRGRAAALATIAVQESAKEVASWLNRLNAGGVAVIEAGSGWASTHHGRDALPGFLRAATEPGVGILWVELLPSGLSHRPSLTLAPASVRASTNQSFGTWKSANGLTRVPQGPGEHVVDTFLQTGNLVGAGGHVLYESVRGGSRGTTGRGKGCFVSLADQGADVRSQLGDEACPLVDRVGAFAAALKMKKFWHGCPVYLTRHGESLMNQTKSMGGDSRLSETGDRYAAVLADFVAAQPDAVQSRLSVWCSPMKRAVQTARTIKCHRYIQWQALRELDTGVFNGYSYAQVEREYSEEFRARERDKLTYRYPDGEGYLDVVNRVDPVVVALEKADGPVMIVSHQAILRCLYAYFCDIPMRQMPHEGIDLHTVVKLTPSDDHQGATSLWKETRVELIARTPLEHLAEAAARKGGKARTASQLGERLS